MPVLSGPTLPFALLVRPAFAALGPPPFSICFSALCWSPLPISSAHTLLLAAFLDFTLRFNAIPLSLLSKPIPHYLLPWTPCGN